MKVTYLGTTMLLFDDGQDQILFDCHITRPSLLRCGLGKLRTDEEVANRVIEDFSITRLAAIFISHTHHDHVMDAPYFAQKCGADIYGSASAMNVALGGGISHNRLHSYDDAKQYQVGRFKVTIIPSIHSIAHWYNNDLGQTIDTPLVQPAKKKAYKEGGSYDFLVEHENTTYLIRPSYNFLPGQLDHINADVLFLPIIMVLSIIGAIAINNRVFDAWIVLIFGILGILMNKFDFPITPIILGFILGPLAETNLRRALRLAKGQFLPLVSNLPSIILICLSLASFALAPRLMKREAAIAAEQENEGKNA